MSLSGSECAEAGDSVVGASVCLIGPARLFTPDGVVCRLHELDARLLAVVAVCGPVERASVAALLWPDAPLPRALHRLRLRIWRLAEKATIPVLTGRDTLRISANVRVDVLEPAGLPRPPDTAATLEPFSHLDLSACGEFAAALESKRSALRRERREAHLAQALADESRGELSMALRHALTATEVDPLHEPSWQEVIRLHYLQGDMKAARETFSLLKTKLRLELAAEPAQETQDLMLLVSAGRQPVRPNSPRRRAELRRPPMLLGRDAELSELDQVLAASGVAVVLGEAGMGKSRLLQEAACEGDSRIGVSGHPGDAEQPFSLLARLLVRMLERVEHPESLSLEVRRELARLVPGWGQAAQGELIEARLVHATQAAATLTRKFGARAIVVDDFHYGDAVSARLLISLAQELQTARSGRKLAFVLACRESEAPHVLRDWVSSEIEARGTPMKEPRRPAVTTGRMGSTSLRVLRLSGLNVGKRLANTC